MPAVLSARGGEAVHGIGGVIDGVRPRHTGDRMVILRFR
jgi:hypothetical protein